VEVLEAKRRGIAVVPRAEMLAELMKARRGIAVAGAHGKTTTTSMISLVFEHAGLDPTAVIGGRFSAFGSNARLGRGEYMVAEADESDGSFLRLSPTVAVITNIDHEHLENYGSFDALVQAFAEFANKVPTDGFIVVCADDLQVRRILPSLGGRVITYGIESPHVEFGAADVELRPFAGRFRALRRGRGATRELGLIRLNVPGRHNVLNALAAIAVGLELGISFERVSEALESFHGVERRFQRIGEVEGVMVVEDYGHHPTEIAAVLAAARTSVERRVVVVFQPHRYTRTQQLMPQFGPAFRDADELVLTDIYAAGEDAIPGVTIEAFADSVRSTAGVPVHVIPALKDVPRFVAGLARAGDLVLVLGAGSVGATAPQIVAELRNRTNG
jgi:UDP-N-acetylmuramate--alanine ligase